MKMVEQNKTCKVNGFTLVEMLVVIGIIGLLSLLMTMGFGRVRKAAIRNDAQQQVSSAAVALNQILLNKRQWPSLLIREMDNGFSPEVCYLLQKGRLMDVTTYKRDKSSGALPSREEAEISRVSLDRLGLLDPWGQAELKRSPEAQSEEASAPGSKITFFDRRLQYRLDKNYDGYVDSSDGEMPKSGMRVRASVIVWSHGEDGKDDGKREGRYPVDDVISWSLSDVSGK